MDQIEAKITTLLRTIITGQRPAGIISCDACDEAYGITGEIETGEVVRTKRPFVSFERTAADKTFNKLIWESRKKSHNHPLGPWYHCNIEIKNRTIRFHYFWEKTPFDSVKELIRDNTTSIPRFAFRHRFDQQMIEELTDDNDVLACLAINVELRLKERPPVPEPLLELYTIGEWQCDMDNGLWKQYFGREHQPTTRLLRSELYPRTYRGLTRIGHAEAVSLYAFAIAVYAHFYPRVETARKELAVAPIRKRNKWDGDDRYWELRDSLTPAQAAYIRSHIAELERL